MAKAQGSYQGELDGLCGPYAITNALTYLGHKDEPEAVFQAACSAISRSRWPKVLWDGTTFGDLKKMIGACMQGVDPKIGAEASYPFWKSTPTSNKDYWVEFDAIFADEDVVCGIVRLTRPWKHWLVILKDGGRITFLDSDPHEPTRRINRPSIYAGDRGPKSKKWVIDRRDLVVFRRTS